MDSGASGGGNEKNFMIAMVLLFTVLAVFSLLQMRQPKAPEQPEQAPAKESAKTETASAAASAPADVKKIAAAKLPAGKEVTLENDDVLAVFDTKGAALKSWKLKNLLGDKQVELVWKENAEGGPFALTSEKAGFKDGLIYAAEKKDSTLTFSGRDEAGNEVAKVFTLQKKGFNLDCEISFKTKTKGVLNDVKLAAAAGIGCHDPSTKIPPLNISRVNGKTEKSRPGKFDIEAPLAKEINTLSWAGVKDKYFAVLFVVPETEGFKGTVKKTMTEITDSNGVKTPVEMPVVSLVLPDFKGEEGKTFKFKVYSGPLIYENLIKYGSSLHDALDYGMFGWLGIIFLKTLKLFHGIVGNWGVAIIMLSLLIKGILWWPNQNSYKSMKKLQEVQPHVNALKEQYKNDPQRMNTEMLKIYKERKINPLSGCFWMLIQMPVLFALYAILGNAIEMKDSPFMFWITDLSGPDKYWVMPILMGATMWVQQKMTPSTDPQQAKMMLWMMPIMFTGMSIYFRWPSGLVLFWFVQNLLSLLQQSIVNKTPSATTA